MFRALRLRLAIGNGVFLAALMVLLGLAGLRSYRLDLDTEATQELQSVAMELVSVATEDGVEAIVTTLDAPADAAFFAGVFASDGTYLGGSRLRPAWLTPKAPFVADETIEGEPVRFVTEPIRLADGSGGSLVVARSLRRVEEAVATAWDAFVRGLVVVVLLSGLVGWWVSGRLIRPVIRSYEAQRAFASDASHELRTPLTFIRAGVEVLAPAKPELGAQVLGEIDYMTSLTDRLLLLARAEDGRLRVDPAPFDLAEVCRRSAERGRSAHGSALELRGDRLRPR
jgi:signal transduction histidine kinase